MTVFTFANNINTTLAGNVSTSATTITLASTANLPASIPSGEVLVITLNDVATRQNFEILYATARTGATLTVLRGQEGTSPLAWLTGDYAYSPPTAGQQGAFGQLAATNAWSGNNSFTNPVVVAPAVTSGEAVNMGQFPSVLLASGSKKIPDPTSPSGYFIENWGTGSITSSGGGNTSILINLPTPYTISHLSCIAGYNGNGPGASLGAIAGAEFSLTQAQITIYSSSAVSSAAVKYWSRGY